MENNTQKINLGSLTRNERLELRKKEIGSKKERKLKIYSDSFNEIFYFFLDSYRKGILNFCGVNVDVSFDINLYSGKETFKRFENGYYPITKPIISKHPNIVKGVIIGKKAWGLFVNEWSDGISECCFTKKEILNQFDELNIKIPKSLLKDFENRIAHKFRKRIELKQFPFNN
jgi:hypothetical protein